MFNRMLGAIRLDVHTFEDVENDTTATFQAMMVVVLVSIASGIGFAIKSMIEGDAINVVLASLVVGLIARPILWAAWALITMVVGTTLLRTTDTHANWGQVARCTGFAQAPTLFNLFVFVPIVGILILVAAAVWQFIAMVVAVRQALDFTSTWRTLGVVFIGFIPYIIVFIVVYWLVGAATEGVMGG